MSLRGSWASFPLHGKGRQSKQLDTEPWAQDEHPGGEKAGRQVAENVCIELPDASAFLGIVTEQSLTRNVDGHGKHEKADGQQHLAGAFAFQLQEDAPPCQDCGTIMVRSGSCYKCLNCGATSGCS